MKTTVVCISPLEKNIENYLKRGCSDESIEFIQANDRDDLFFHASRADVLIGWSSDRELLEKSVKFKLFINPSTGVNQHIQNFRDLNQKRSVVLVNSHGHAYSVAQHGVSLLLALSNSVIPHHQKMVTRKTEKPIQNNTLLKDKTVGFLGYGSINRNIHNMLRGFDLKFTACKRTWTTEDTSPPTSLKCYKADQINRLFEKSDIVINALPHTRDTHHSVGNEQFKILGKNAFFINLGRGATVVEEDLYNALNEGVISGAALDVWWPPAKEKRIQGVFQPYTYPFHELDNIVMSPHRAADNTDALDRWDDVIENILCLHEGRSDFKNIVDLELEY